MMSTAGTAGRTGNPGRVVGLLVGLAWSAWPVGSAVAQSEDAPLAGPRVESRELPGVREEYVPSETARAFGAAQRVPLQAFLQVLRELNGEETAAELRLTAEQAAEIREEVRRYGADLAEFVGTHGEVLRELVEELPQRERGRALGELRSVSRVVEVLDRIERGGGVFGERRARAAAGEARDTDEAPEGRGFRLDLDPGMRGMMEGDGASAMLDADSMMMMNEDGTPDVRARVQALRAAAPSVAGLQTRVWAALSPEQREVFGASLDRFLQEARAENEARRLRLEAERREAETPKVASDVAPRNAARQRAAAGGAINLSDEAVERLTRVLAMGDIPQRLWDRLPEQVRARLSALPEEERAAALARWLRERRAADSDD
ncbi:MAG: hypothetical protein ACF8LK_04070 [Phycisphaerales bacterium JB041]